MNTHENMIEDCTCSYPDEAEIREIEQSIAQEEAITFKISHHYDIGNQDVYVKRARGSIDGRRAAIYCQFMAEEWFGADTIISNLGIAAMLVTFYGFHHTGMTHVCSNIDMYHDREKACGPNVDLLLNDKELWREGLKEAIKPHIDGR